MVAFDFDLYYSWKSCFDNIEGVEVVDGDILQEKGDAIVSPANSFGYMDGGLDLKYSTHFGWDLEQKVRNKLESDYFGEIPVGQAIVVPTGLPEVKYLVSAPTMRVPSDISETVNAYLAFKGIIQSVLAYNRENNGVIGTVLCPGLGTGEGKMSASVCAKQMLRAYKVCLNNEMLRQGGLASAVNDHIKLLR